MANISQVIACHGYGSIFELSVHFWNLKVMPSTQFYVWRALLDKIATKMNLHKRRIILGDTLCPLCGREEESTSHILITCVVSSSVWNMCNSWLEISTVNHNVLVNHFDQFLCLCFNKAATSCGKVCRFR